MNKYIGILSRFFSQRKPTMLGRWSVEHNDKNIGHKVYWANLDHCGSCDDTKDKYMPPSPHLNTLAISLECGAELRGMATRYTLEKVGWLSVPGRVHLFEKDISNIDISKKHYTNNVADFDKQLADTATDLMLVLEPVSAHAPPKGKHTFVAVGRVGLKHQLDALPPCWKRLKKRRYMFIARNITWKDGGAETMPSDILFYRLVAGNPFPDVTPLDPQDTAISTIRRVGIRL